MAQPPGEAAAEAEAAAGGAAEDEQTLRLASSLASAGDHEAAIELLRAERQRRPSLRLDLNLADALARAGRLREARELLRSVARAGEVNPLVAEAAGERLRRLAERVPELELRLRGRAAEDARFVIDGRTATPAAEGATAEVDPGDHLVELVSAEGRTLASARISVDEGQRRRVLLRAPDPPLERAEAAAREPDPPAVQRPELLGQASPARAGPSDDDDPWPWIAVGAGAAVALTAAVIIGVVASSGGATTMGDVEPVFVGRSD